MTPLRLLVVLLLLLPGLLGVERPRGLGDVDDVRFWSYADYTRVVVELTSPIAREPVVKRLGANRSADLPPRLYVDLPELWVGRRYEEGVEVGDGLLRGVRLGQNTLRTTRVVVDLERYARHRLIVLRSPDRLVIDVYGSRSESSSAVREIERTLERAPRLSMPLRKLRTVVIDPGHGGRDPGALGRKGLREKDVNLKLAKLLAEKLRALDFRVVMTREGDRTLSLEERTAIAESANGDLFVSLHANASDRRATRGFEIYYLDESHERHNLRVAARENGVPVGQVDSLQRALSRFRVSEASTHANRLANHVHAAIAEDLSRRNRGFVDLGVKRGPFYVLFLASMPSILVESGFVTNDNDAKLLADPGFLNALAQRIADGLTRYRDGMPLLSAGAGG